MRLALIATFILSIKSTFKQDLKKNYIYCKLMHELLDLLCFVFRTKFNWAKR